MKKRFSKKKAKYKKATRSGLGSREAKQAETELKKYYFLSWLAPYLRLKENTVSNLPNANVAEINPNNDGITEAKDNFSDCSEKSLFSSVLTNQSFETPWQRHCRVKRRKEEVKQAPEKPRKELEIMEDISKSLQSTASSDDLFRMIVAEEIKNLSPKKKRKIKFEINNLFFKYQEGDDAAAIPQSPPIQVPPPIQTYGNINTNLPSISLAVWFTMKIYKLKYIK